MHYIDQCTYPNIYILHITIAAKSVLNAEGIIKQSTMWAIKTFHFVFNYNSVISWSIFTLFVPLETGMNTLKFTYLMA